jgi:hypothetical protein
MRPNKELALFVILTLLLASCVKRYEPEIESKDAVKFVVSGEVNKGDDIQHVNISTTSPVSQPKNFPITGCVVKIIDDKGNSYTATDMLDGNYDVQIPQNKLVTGTSYKVDILVPGGINIVSDFDQMHDCPEVDTLYYELESIPASNPVFETKGIQFYTNLNAQNIESRYFRWEAIESYEYHAVYPIEWFYDGTLHHILPPDHSRQICWKTGPVKNIFTLTTKNFAQNRYDLYPLHFVDNVSSSRLVYGYSLLLRQYALSEAAFNYWEKLRINSVEQGGLYEKQPLVIKGNMHNITNPEQEILGFFSASSVSSKRIFIKDVENLPSEYDPGCSTAGEEPRRTGLKGIPKSMYPAYLYATQYSYLLILLDNYCYDCLTLGGDTIKPAFWPR